MDKTEQLKEILSHYWGLPPQEIFWEMQFNDRQLALFSSLRMLRFLASVEERFHIQIEDPDSIKTFRDLLGLIGNHDPTTSVDETVVS